ncbi:MULTISPECIES: 30S ribosomal protein S4 [Natrinema]|uniref:Small ribosomal subunit protein uS4 n=4 Tax=Natrinema TaxID=88723 RepID=A0A482XTU0_9EURY|nr:MULTISPECIES: 30S ribosomal protein S4 [Natrinema]AFO56338.1 ribosomal protein S4 [Natrinema sp. J7-2]ELY79832.1 30S ribosomal protein S4P [Natrinema pallidum DSM 3751]ELY83256.1 30S ribosomal protein S4P [Natrinema gari JCM 14663]QCW02293.1 30S ribosomal protein S4 [Natrinema pallidum]RZH66661.1 30S ribosomal protein S4 [Natrinema altunense]
MPLGTDTKQYETPNHPYQGERIASEHSLVDRYGLSNKEELWRAQSELRSYRREARELLGQAQDDDTVVRRSEEFLGRLKRVGILDETDELGDILSLEIEDILERRLQTVVYRNGLANTAQQARQFITHGHIVVDGQRHLVPSYVVDIDEEDLVAFDENSPLADDLHPERAEGQ